MKILFVMDRRENAGSIQAIANYVRAGDQHGHTIALYGRPDPRFPSVRSSTDVEAFDHVVFVLESQLEWLSALRIPRIFAGMPRDRRAVLDADGMYNRLISVDGYDRNYPDEMARQRWLETQSLLAGRVFQPTARPRAEDVRPLPFYGFDPEALKRPNEAMTKRYDVLHVAHNWWRWREVSARLLPALERIRRSLDGICFMGSWWDAPPFVDEELKVAFQSDPQWLERLRIRIEPAVPYTEVIHAMSTARVNVMTQRPLLRSLRLLTSKYFEIFAADTIPLVMLDPEHAESVYGAAGRELALATGIGDKLRDALQFPRKYRDIVETVRDHLLREHSYTVRVQQLVAALEA